MPAELPEHVQAIVDTILSDRRRHDQATSAVQRTVIRLTRAAARPRFLAILAVLAAFWIVLNLLGPWAGYTVLDSPPFPALANMACILALGVTVLILITQRHEQELAEHRADLTLQLAILNEQKSAKTIQLLDELRRDLPSLWHSDDPELAALAEPADPTNVLDAIREGVVEATPVRAEWDES